jgi:hypothetical protein
MLPAALRDAEGVWYGRDGLWASVPHHPANRVGDFYDLKHAWVTVDGTGGFARRHGPPKVSAVLLGGHGRADGSSGGYAYSGALEFWPTVVRFPSEGCWAEIASIGDVTVRLVVRVHD